MSDHIAYRPSCTVLKGDLPFVPAAPYSIAPVKVESLPFRVRLVSSSQDLAAAVEIRSSAYARHVPEVGRQLQTPEPDDFRGDVLCLLAERKIDGWPLGSVRLQPNFNRPLRIEGEGPLPSSYSGRRLVEFMRLGVRNGTAGGLVTFALVKAGFEICHRADIDFILAAGRRSVATLYRGMAFDDLLDGETVALSYASNLPHGLFGIPVREVDRRLPHRNPALYAFMAGTSHPDIDVDYDRVQAIFGP